MPPTSPADTLFYGDNLDILRNDIADESVDLIYLDPPFNSNATYNVIFTSPGGERSQAQVQAFKDSWNWQLDGAESAYADILKSQYTDAAELIVALRRVLGESDLMAYLAMMAVRLIELHRVLKPTGSLYLHCDPTASHYLKILLDAVFGPKQFINEIVWKRSDAKGDAGQGSKHFGRVNDSIFLYSKTPERTWNPLFGKLDEDYVRRFYRYADPDGQRWKLDNMLGPGGASKGNPSYDVMGVYRHWRYSKERMQALIAAGRVVQTNPGTVPMYKRYLHESKGTPLTSNWTDVGLLRGWSKERLGYPTQKPVALLERIVSASSNEGDLVLDPFCGCGTTVHAAQKLNRRWIGIDITHLAVRLIERRLTKAFPGIRFEIRGVPQDLGGAQALADADKYQFQLWALSLVEAQPFKGGVKGADGGVDGIVWFRAGAKTAEKAIVSVKGGKNVSDAQIKDLIATVEHTGAKMGFFVTLAPPTRPMIARAATAGFYEIDYGRYPKIQILTIAGLLNGKTPDAPLRDDAAFKTPKREETGKQSEFDV